MSIAFLVSVWFPSKAIDGIRGGFVRAYGPARKRNWIVGRAISILCVGLGVLITLLLSLLIVLGPILSGFLSTHFETLAPYFTSGLRNLVGFAIFVLFLWFLHRILSGKRFGPEQHLWTGVLTTAILWVAVAIGFGLFLDHSTGYQLFYGALAGIAISMLFFYYSAMCILLSAEINAALDTHRTEANPA